MTSRVGSIREAYAVLGLDPGAGFKAAKSAFRDAAKRLHPDVSTPSPDTLSELADIVAAIRMIEANRPACLEIEVTAADAQRGVSRALKLGDKPVIVRIPAGTEDGAQLAAVGEDNVMVTISIRETADGWEKLTGENDDEALSNFVDEFSRPSPMSRFARWIRNSQSVA
ncbi:J domain-containing protein [Maricaulis sp.]|uniref:J domain-containing protein n=1 Tax=unclassified Maricaulis TaxID=2632371 RepID=UPI001B286E67|nr:J domain-containing protein [Maricaulis sp.]MBO6797207.1 J domain-containing protein [Maricaulis sp.]